MIYKRIDTYDFFISKQHKKLNKEIKKMVKDVLKNYPDALVDVEITVKVIDEPPFTFMSEKEWKEEQERMK